MNINRGPTLAILARNETKISDESEGDHTLRFKWRDAKHDPQSFIYFKVINRNVLEASEDGESLQEIARTSTASTQKLPGWKNDLLKVYHANFLRYRKPSPERVRSLVKKTFFTVNMTSADSLILYDTAKKAFENMRHDFMKETRKIAEAIEHQLMEYVLLLLDCYS